MPTGTSAKGIKRDGNLLDDRDGAVRPLLRLGDRLALHRRHHGHGLWRRRREKADDCTGTDRLFCHPRRDLRKPSRRRDCRHRHHSLRLNDAARRHGDDVHRRAGDGRQHLYEMAGLDLATRLLLGCRRGPWHGRAGQLVDYDRLSVRHLDRHADRERAARLRPDPSCRFRHARTCRERGALPALGAARRLLLCGLYARRQ